MKGVYSSPDSLHHKLVKQGLFPHNTYVHDSGGDPLSIPTLNFTQFKEYHSAYYHPSNARVFFYGDDDPIVRLDKIEAYFSEYQRKEVNSRIVPQPRLDMGGGYVTGSYPVSADAEENVLTTVMNLIIMFSYNSLYCLCYSSQ